MLQISPVLPSVRSPQHDLIPVPSHHVIWLLLIRTCFVSSAPTEPSLPLARLTLSHGTFCQHSPYIFACFFWVSRSPASWSLMSTSSSSKLVSLDILVLSTLLNSNSAGLFPVVDWDVDLYARRNLFNSSLQFFPYTWASLIAFLASPLHH